MAFQLFADSKRQSKMDAAYAVGFDPDAPTAQNDEDAANEAALYAEYNGDPIRNIEIDADPEMPRRMSWKMDW